MKYKVANVTIDGRTYAVSYNKKVKNLVVEYAVQIHSSLLQQKGVGSFRFQVYSPTNIIFPDGTKTAVEKDIKLKIANGVVETEGRP